MPCLTLATGYGGFDYESDYSVFVIPYQGKATKPRNTNKQPLVNTQKKRKKNK